MKPEQILDTLWDRERQQSLLARWQAVRERTLALAAPLTPEDCQVQSMPDASPLKWHLAHTTWFFETFVLERGADYAALRPEFRVLYNSYYNGIGEAYPRPQRGLLSRPSLDEVLAYRRHVDAQTMRLLESQRRPDAEVLQMIELGVNHEEQHQELILTDLKHLLSCNPLNPAYEEPRPMPAASPTPLTWVRRQGGIEWIGHGGAGFHYDNEAPRHRQFVGSFELASRLVTNGEYAAFIEDGGYSRPELWLSLGWDALQSEGWRAPLYWRRREGRWRIFTLQGECDLEPHAPLCHVSLFEADAYARWAGARLPTEAEWESVAAPLPVKGNLLDSRSCHPRPLAGSAEGAPQQMFGDVWEWTFSAYSPYPGFRAVAGPVGEYNGKFMCNQYVLRGGSCVTPREHIRASYRNFFPPATRWQFSGIRLARDVEE